jgi:hypothetical protein
MMANTRRTIKGYKDDASLAGQTVREPGRAAAFATRAPRISTS